MRTARAALIAASVVLVGAATLAVPASAQRTPRQPRGPGGEPTHGAQWVPGMNLYPKGTPTRTAPASEPPARAVGAAAASSASPAGTPTALPTPEPTVEPTRTQAPIQKSSSGLGLMPLLSVLGLALVTGPIVLLRRRRRQRPDAPPAESLVPDAEPEWEPEPEWEAEPMQEADPEPETETEAARDPEPAPEPEPTIEAGPTTDAGSEPISPPVDAVLCENCGRENPAEFLFCDDCGQLLKWSES